MIVLIILFLSTVSGERIKKCCPIDEVVSFDLEQENSVSLDSPFTCVSSNATQNISQFSHFKFIGYNTLVDYDSHWPACGDQSLSYEPQTDRVKVSQSSSCLDIMDGKYQIFTCTEKTNLAADFTEIMKIKKCCSAGMSYDIFRRRCVEGDEAALNSDFNELLTSKTVLFEHEVLKCKDNEALVEYHSLVHGMNIRGSSLILTNTRASGPDVIKHSFCIDATMNSDAEIPDGMDEEHFDKKSRSKFIAKACRNKSVCEDMPCLQKCCPHGERMFHDGVKTQCESHHADVELKFHSFNKDQSQQEPPPHEPTGEYIYFASFECIFKINSGSWTPSPGPSHTIFVCECNKFREGYVLMLNTWRNFRAKSTRDLDVIILERRKQNLLGRS